jgi:molecular chaperone GrpE
MEMTEDKHKNLEEHLADEPMNPETETMENPEAPEENPQGTGEAEELKGEDVIEMKEMFKKKKELQDSLKKSENENAALKDRLQRLSAEYDNYRKRTQKEKEGLYADSINDVVKTILPILDSLEASLQVEHADLPSMRKGVEMTLGIFQDALQKLKVEEVSTTIPFDPNFHDAVMHVDDPALGEKEIVQVFIKGYQREDKIIRYSVVKVAN